MHRRQLLRCTGAIAAVAIAGCSGGDDDGGDGADGEQRVSGDDGSQSDGEDSGGNSTDGNGGDSGGDSTDGDGEDSGGDSTDGDGGAGTDGGGDGGGLTILEHEWYQEEFNAGVQGQLRNESGEAQEYVEVHVYFLDSEGVQISDNFTNTSDLADGRTWEFDVLFLGDDPDRVAEYEIETSDSAM